MNPSHIRSQPREPIAEGDPLPPETLAHEQGPVSLDILYRDERPRLLRWLARRGVRHDALDIVHRAFARLVDRDSRRPNAIAQPTAYLRVVANNLLIDDARSTHRGATAVFIPLEDVELASGDPHAALEARDMLRRLDAAIAGMKPTTREIFLAHRVNGYSYAEIAARTGLSVKRVGKHMSRAIVALDRDLRA